MTDPQSKTNMMGKIYNADYPTAGIDTTVTFNHSKSKTIRTIIRQYRVDADVAYSEVKDNVHTVEEYHNALKKIEDLALSDISKIIDEEVIGNMEYRETEDMSLKTWSDEDLKAFGRNELRNEQREKLNKILGDK